jgi:flagellar basal body-associated protein FliL
MLLAVVGVLAGGGGGSYWYMARAAAPPSAPEVAAPGSYAFIDMDRKFVVPLVRGDRVRSLVVVDLRLEVAPSAEDRARDLKPRLRDALLDALFAMAIEGAFDGDLYSNNIQSEMRAKLLTAARKVLQEDVAAVLIGELLRQDQ